MELLYKLNGRLLIVGFTSVWPGKYAHKEFFIGVRAGETVFEILKGANKII